MLKSIATLVAIPALTIIIFVLLVIWICKMIKHNVEIGSSFKDPKHQEKRTSLRKTSLPFRLAIFFLIVITEIETLPVWHRRNPPIESPNDFALISAREFAKTISLGTNEDRWNLAEIIFKTENLNLTNFHNVTIQKPNYLQTTEFATRETKTTVLHTENITNNTTDIPMSFRKGKRTLANLMITIPGIMLTLICTEKLFTNTLLKRSCTKLTCCKGK